MLKPKQTQKPKQVNSFSFHCAVCGQHIGVVHIIVRVLSSSVVVTHLCSYGCGQRWFGGAP